MNRVQFSEAVFQSIGGLRQYLASDEAIARVQKRAMNPYVPGVSGASKLNHLQASWTIFRFAFFDLQCCFFLRVLGAMLYYVFHMRSAALSVYVKAWRLETYANMVFDNYFRSPYKNILVDAINTFSYDAKEVYEHKPICLANCDKEVLVHVHPEHIFPDGKVHFDLNDGECVGLCNWQAYLYFKTRACFHNSEHHLMAVTEEVRDGAGKEAALLQLFQRKAPLSFCFGLKERWVAAMKNPTVDKVSAVFNRLRHGLYEVITIDQDSSSGHRMNLAVTKEGTYLFDPGRGLIKEDPTKLFSQKLIEESFSRLAIAEIFQHE